MNSPACNIALPISERKGVEIDYCPNCRGIWLNRGELDKIIERSAVSGNNQNQNFDLLIAMFNINITGKKAG